MKIDHVQLAMPKGQEDVARTFYRDVLELTEIPKPAPLAVDGGAWFSADDVELHLGAEDGFRPARKAHPAIRVADLDALAARCQAAGHGVEFDDRYPGVRRCYVHDPFGNRIELMQAAPATAFAGEDVRLLLHFLAAIAYRTQKAVRAAAPEFAMFSAGNEVRTPMELVRHMASVIGYARTFFVGGSYRPEPLATFEAEQERLHTNLQDLGDVLRSSRAPVGAFADLTPARLLQGPLADAMTHAGQLALLRRLAGDPVPSENFVHADIDPDRVGIDQAEPVSPDQ
ncbi:MAG TPA: VOC family protein [Trueperaceae bacterium]|nr:VOC family protein [Trueperaceae bacterium]